MEKLVNNVVKQEWNDGITRCPICGKKFLISYKKNYAYKFRNINGSILYYCSYSCLNKGKEEVVNNRKYKFSYVK